MNFCMKSPLEEKHELIIDKLKCTKNEECLENVDQLQQNFTKLTLPNPVIRSSSLTKISQLCSQSNQKDTKNDSDKKSGSKITNKLQRKLQNTNQKQRKNIENSTKQAIFNKLLQKNQISTKAFNNINNKQNHNQKQKTNIPPNTFYHKHQNVNKLVKLYQQKQEQELRQCTFNPKISAQNTERNHDLKEFYKHQIEHSQKTTDKIEQLRQMIKSEKEKENTFKPKLSQETIELTQRRVNHNVYERLYHKKSENQEQTQNNSKRCDSFRKQTSKKSISLISSSRKKYENHSNMRTQNKKQQKQQCNMNSKQLHSERSLKKFHQMLQIKQSNFSAQLKKKQDNQNLYCHWKKSQNFSKESNETSSKKKTCIDNGPQKLDCKFILQQKRDSKNNYLSRQQSCKLLPSSSTDRIQTSKGKYQNKQWVRDKNSLHMKNKTSQKTLKIALEKFIKQFIVVSSKMNIKTMIELNQIVQLLKNLNFIQNVEEFYESSVDAELKVKVFEIWTILEGTESGFIVLENLLKILCAIQGFTNASMIEEALKNVIQSFNAHQFFETKHTKSLVLSEKDSKMIKNDFLSFHLTRFKLGQSKFYSRQLKNDQFTYHPSISRQSEQYAEKYREKIIQEGQQLIEQGLIDFNVPEDGLIDHSALLILAQKIKNYKIEQKRLQSVKEKIRKQNESMQSHSVSHRSINDTSLTQKHKKSFKVEESMDSNAFSRISHNESQSRSKDQIFTELYEQGRRSKSNRRDKSTEEIQYESNKGELTFKPKTNQGKITSEFKDDTDLYQNIPNFTKQVMRMRSNKNLQRDQMSISPLLYLNVTMQGNSQTKIPVYQKDTFQEIVEKVRVIMKIQNGQQQKNKLKHILKEQIIPVLNQLGIYEKEGRFFSGK